MSQSEEWTNSLISDEYIAGALPLEATPAAKINLANYYQWEIRLANSMAMSPAAPSTVYVAFEDPSVHTGTPTIAVFMDPAATGVNLIGSSIILSSAGVNMVSNQANVWIWCDTPQVKVVVWGSRRA